MAGVSACVWNIALTADTLDVCVWVAGGSACVWNIAFMVDTLGVCGRLICSSDAAVHYDIVFRHRVKILLLNLKHFSCIASWLSDLFHALL